MSSKTAIVGSTVGLHARPAAVIAAAAIEYEDPIFLSFGGNSVSAASTLLIMSLGAEHLAEVTVESQNADAVERLASLIEQNLDD
ncbi:MAG: HPr family phosphocarrier protein [Tessaracoccus sp.]|uniref:HPr family phosphocarrier protein n=1 Tax=Tessaracoccus sp. TaxID=1971211 RepID=UPI001ECFC62F|nr:HPr family phosphocarrier protein [Tessaracoccus sp.]MBK7822737.1 HPr family phosphocarrier protein [Tessaracoccus sp.]